MRSNSPQRENSPRHTQRGGPEALDQEGPMPQGCGASSGREVKLQIPEDKEKAQKASRKRVKQDKTNIKTVQIAKDCIGTDSQGIPGIRIAPVPLRISFPPSDSISGQVRGRGE